MQSKPAGAPQHKWQTLWLVIGPRLPSAEIRLRDGIVLAKLADENFEHLKKAEVPVPKISASMDNFVVHYPPRDVVQSRYKLQVDIADDEQGAALDRAAQIVNRLLLSLSLSIPGGRYHAELRKIRRSGDKQEHSAWSETVGITPWSDPRPLEEGDLTRALKLFDAVEKDETAENAFIHLMTAWQLQDTAGAKPLQRSVLQHYVLCVETIVNGVMATEKASRRDRIRLAERKFAEEFSGELSKRADKPEAIRAASTRLREIGLLNMIPSIETAVPLLGLSSDMEEQAKALYRFRSSSLSHPGRTTGADFKKWLHSAPTVSENCLADTVARAFLSGYCAQAV